MRLKALISRSYFDRRVGDLVLVAVALLTVTATANAAEEDRPAPVRIKGESLVRNLVDISPVRDVYIYLPPSYHKSNEKYPVVYLLHGNTLTARNWLDGHFQEMNIMTSMDNLIGEGRVNEMIVVMPDANTRFQGSHYVNSPVFGAWSDFITRDLVNYVDSTYRTIPETRSRGLAGFSMGGRGTLYLAMKYPKVFGAIYGMSCGQMDFANSFGKPPEDVKLADWRKALSFRPPSELHKNVLRIVGLSMAFSPNSVKAPYYADLPFDIVSGDLRVLSCVIKEWEKFDPIRLVATHGKNLRHLNAIRFDCGREDVILSDSQAFARELDKAGITYSFDTYEGDHQSQNRHRVENHMLPYFSEVLSRD